MSEREHRFPPWVMQAIIGILLGVAAGFAIGWWFWPVQYTNTAPNVLRRDYRDDYILMIATAYEVEGDSLEQAQERLMLLDPENPAAPVIELAERLIDTDGRKEDITHLAHLALALGTTTPKLDPHLEDSL